MRRSKAAYAAVLLALTAVPVHAQTIYPINRAEFLAGAKFDLKVEFPGSPKQAAVHVTINGQDAAAIIGKGSTFSQRHEGNDYSAYWIRDAAILKPGKYT